MALAPGSTLGPYRIIEPLGRGGMASVYKAYEAALDRYVALKVLPGEFLHDETFAERFRREAKTVAKLEHPNIIPIHAFGIDDGIPWMAMRLIAGGTLSAVLQKGRLSAERVIATLRGVAEALDYAHQNGVVHRDVKPQNVLLDQAQRVYLADFGIARMVEGSNALTQTGMISGTPHYMAPEQATAKPVDHRADIYALGIVAYEMLIGRVPFAADTPVAILIKHVQEPMPLPSPADVPAPMVQALLKAVAKSPDDRWPSATSFTNALADGLAEHAGIMAETPTVYSDAASGPRPSSVSLPPAASIPSSVGLVGSSSSHMPGLGGAAPAGTLVISKKGLGIAAAATAVAATALVIALAAGFFLLRRDPEPPAAPAAAPEPARTVPTRAYSAPLPAVRKPAPAPSARRAEREDAADAPIDEAPGRLAIDFEHPLKSGTLTVWIDQEVVLQQRLDGRVTKKLVGIKLRKGSFNEIVDVSPGRHTVRVQVAWDDNRKSETIPVLLEPGDTRRLEVRLGRLRKDLSLDYK
jgi:serine/threonine protein kinase